MCGLFGIAGNGITLDDLKAFKQLGQVSTLRGQDGTGIMQAKAYPSNSFSKTTWFIQKDALEVNDFFQYHLGNPNGNKLIIKSTADNVFMGHTRWATRGALIKSNCHPFKYNNIIGAHNGTLNDKQYQCKDITDSEILIENFSKQGMKKTLSDLDSFNAYAVSVFNIATGKLSFARNTQRDLFLCFNSHRSVLYWASEARFLEFVLCRCGIKHEDILIFSPYKIYSINPWDIVSGRDGPWSVEEYTQKTYIFTNNKKKNKKNKGIDYGWGDWSEFSDWQTELAKEADRESNKAAESAKVFIKNEKGGDLSKDEIPFKLNPKIPPRETCGDCGRSLNLAEQFFAKEIVENGKTTIQCADCTYQLNNGIKTEDVARSMLT